MFEGSKDAKILFVSDFLRAKEVEANSVLTGERRDILVNALSSAGILASDYAMTVIHPTAAKGNKITGFDKDERIRAQIACKNLINESKANVIVPLGENALRFITGMDGIQKQHLSILPVKAEFGARKAVPFLHPETIQRSYGDVAYIRFGAMRLREEMSSTTLNIPERKFHLSLDWNFDQIISYLEEKVLTASEVSTDVETGNGVINTVGLAISPYEAISIEVGPTGKTPAEHKKLWDIIGKIWESESIGKIAQNGLFESYWASLYGIKFNNLSFDTMLAMKFLHPTLERGLDNVGRIYTRFPYWKDDHSDWNNVRDWRSHLTYCGKDVTGQFAAKENMSKALEARGLANYFREFIMRGHAIAHEMQVRGMRIEEDALKSVKRKLEMDILAITESFQRSCEERVGKTVNLNSPKQVKEALKAVNVKIPTSKGKETVSKAALMKLKLKYPKEVLIKDLLKILDMRKKIDDYLNFDYDSDGKVRCSYDLSNDENGTWVGRKNIFDKGFDATNTPLIVKNCIIPDDGKTFVEVRLNQPELRFIAEDAGDHKLIEMLANHQNVSKYIAGKIFRKDTSMLNPTETKIGSQVIKSANEMDTPKQFIEKCFARCGQFFQDHEAKRFMQIYLEEFPQCRNRIERIKKEMFTKRMLKAGAREITYYDRVNDSLFRRALSFVPDSRTNDLLMQIIFTMAKHPQIEFIARGKTSVLVQLPTEQVFDVCELSLDRSIVEILVGNKWGVMENV